MNDTALTSTIFVAAAFVISYIIGSIPNAYLITRAVTGEDVTDHGTGNVGAMNVKRTTGSWGWFTVAMVADAMKGIAPVWTAKAVLGQLNPLQPFALLIGRGDVEPSFAVMIPAALLGAVMGHNFSLWMAVIHRRFARTGKGLATGGGALLVYDWRYFIVVVGIGLLTIAFTRYLMAGQVAAALALPSYAGLTSQPDVWFCVLLGALVYAAHHRRFIGLLRGTEPRLYTQDHMGPRG